MTESTSPVKALGEIALRVTNLELMQHFYQEVIGLTLLKRFEHAAFFKISDGYAGHTQIVALFDRSDQADYQGLSPALTTVDHFAFAIDLADYQSERERLEAAGLRVELAEHAWVHWRSLFVTDPEGNRVEFVCYDESVA
jgi:catechol 2,3-dioxygenase-like lactoylglutathione lyase family enzyme